MEAEGLLVTAKAYLLDGRFKVEEVKKSLAAANPGSLVQAVKQGSVGNVALVEMLAAQTFAAQLRGGLLAKKPEVDLLLRVADTTQISKAIRAHGVVAGEGFVAIVAGEGPLVVPPEVRGAELPDRRLTRQELARIERAALLDARRG
jgi:hypothetical protein